MPNRLANETSPYLLQHADNPVDWYPWGEEALQKARDEDKPIFLTIGYSACHWCHVMAHESFEDEAVAAILNEHLCQHQGRSRGAARPGPHLHERRAGHDRRRRLAHVGLSHARWPSFLRRHLLPAAAALRYALLHPGPGGHRRRLARPPRRTGRQRPARLLRQSSSQSTVDGGAGSQPRA